MHSLGGCWVAEGTGPGPARVAVTQLLVFSALGGLAKKGVQAACLAWDPRALVDCLARKGVE